MRQRTSSEPTLTGALLARRLFLDRQSAFWRQQLWDERARLVDIVAETADTRTLVLQPPRRWRRHQAGQHTTVEVEIGGVRLRRCYSISSAPHDRHVAVTVKRLAGGRVSSWLHERVRVGDRLALGPATGDFVLPATPPGQLLFVSGGSGITPILSMLRELDRRRALTDAVVVHHARNRDDVIFRSVLERLVSTNPGLRLILSLSDAPGGRFDEERFAQLVPDFAARQTFLCGPPGLMARVDAMWRAAGASRRLSRERFVAVAAPPPDREGEVQLQLTRSARGLVATTAGTLLEQLERAGVQPPYGCRVGVCHTCQCRKRSGTVENILTGAISREGEEEIQLCISRPRSDVELEL